MDTTVSQLGAVVVAALRAAGYMESTIGQYERTIKVLDRFVARRGGVYTRELGAQFAAMTTSPHTGRFSAARRFTYTRIVAVFDSYVHTGQVDLATRKRGGGGCCPTSEDFIALDAAWEAEMNQRGLAPATREAYGRVARSYLRYLEDRGITSLSDADGASITGFLEYLLERWAASSLFWVMSNFRPFVKFTGHAELLQAVNLVKVQRHHAVLPVLSDDDAQRVVDACARQAVPARDAAITLLALMTGLRACDIIDLRLSDVDWRAGTLSLVQSKTKNSVMLPLPGLVVAQLADYVLAQRPAGGTDHLFLRSIAPHSPLADHASIYRITAETFRKAGVAEVKAGTRFLRHAAASRLLRAGTPLPTISAVLGHASEESTKVYMSVDTERLRACVLPLPAGARP